MHSLVLLLEVTNRSTLTLVLKLYTFSSGLPDMQSNPSLPMHLGLLLIGMEFGNVGCVAIFTGSVAIWQPSVAKFIESVAIRWQCVAISHDSVAIRKIARSLLLLITWEVTYYSWQLKKSV